MPLEVEATYENGILKLDGPLPFEEHERIVVTVKPKVSRIGQSAGLLRWTGDPQALQYLLGPESQASIVEGSYGLLGWTGDSAVLRRIAEDDACGVLESP
ncbi:MAG: antitoxin family protein [Planctomycetota bacterium]|nr:antitoxin family protein [Planctomycetota bacterium]